MSTSLKYLILSAALLGWLSAIGYPARRLLDRPRGPRAAVPAPFVGMAIVQVTGWYWLEAGGHGLRIPMVALTVGAVVALAITFRTDREAGRRTDRRRLTIAAGALGGAALVIGLNFSTVLALPNLETADTGNNDAAAYALVADHAAQSSFSDPGSIVGYDLGEQARTNAFGSTVLVGSFSSVTDVPAYKVNEVVLFTLSALAVFSLALLVNELLEGRAAVAVAVGVATACTLLFTFVATLFFLGQLMAMSVLPLLAVVGLRAAERHNRSARLRLMGSAAILFLILLSHYAQMAFLAPPVLVPALLLASSSSRLRMRELRERLRAIAVVFVGGFLVAAVVVPIWIYQGVKVALFQKDAVAGFPLPGFLPVELFGFMRQTNPQPSAARVVWSAVLLFLVGLASLVAWRSERRVVRFCVAMTVAVLVSYAAVYRFEGGPSYQQWKWITFLQPMLVGVGLTTVVLGLGIILARHWSPRTVVGLTVAAVLLYGVVVSTNTGDGVATALRDRRQFAVTTPEQADLSTNPAFDDVSALNVDLSPYWDTMWAAYFLQDKTLRLQSVSYYPLAPVEPGWSLIPMTPALSGPTVRPVNRAYELLHVDDAPLSDQPDGLDATVVVELDPSVAVGGSLKGTARITNTGTRSWLPSGASIGAVNLGAHLADAMGTLIEPDWQRMPLAAGIRSPLPAGTTVTIPLSLPAPPVPGRYEIRFEPVSEQVSWFGTAPSVEVTVSG
jgi:hypothetical protein